MQFELNDRPEPIILDPNGDGDVITIQHQRLTATERATALELTEQELASSMRYLYGKYLAWDGVTDKSGTPIPIKTTGADGATTSNVDRVFGMLPFGVSIEAWIKQMVLNGVPLSKMERAAKTNLDERQLATLREVADRLGKSPAKMAGASSIDS